MNLPDSGVPSNKSTAAADSLSNSQTPSSDATQNLAYEIETYGRPRLTSSSSSATPSPSPVNYYDPESASPYARERKPSTLRVPKPLSTPISGSPLPKNIHFEDTPLLTAERNQLEHHRQLIRVDEDFSMQFSGYQTPATRLALYYCLCVLSGGTVYLLTRWFPRLQIRLIGKPVSLADATHVFIENSWQQEDLVNIRRDFYGQGLLSVLQAISGNGNTTYPAAHEVRSGSVISSTLANLPDMNFLRYFNYRCMMFLFNPLAGTFVENTAWKDPRRPISAQVLSQGLDRQAHQERRLIFGDNSIEIPEKGTIRLLVDEVLHPFYIFQALAIALWCFDQYYYYAVCIMLTSIVSCTLALLETKRNLRNLRNMARFQCDVPVLRSSVWRMVPSTELVPGDIVDIGSGEFSLFPCDCVLLSGDCIVNESMLTGESVPVFKTPANDSDLLAALGPSLEINPKYYLFGGTKIVRVRAPAGAETDSSTARGSTTPSYQQQQQQDYLQSRSLALVVRTGFDTSKGNLIREMIFPRPHQFQFYRDSFRFVGVLALIAMLGFTVSVVFLLQQNVPLETILVRGLDLFTIVVPPALPAAMSIGITFALTRLKRANIFCISPPRINITGKCNVVVFDKTGTLTEEGMDVLGVQNVISGRFEEITSESNKLPNEPPTSPNTSQSILNLPEEKLDQVLSGGADYAPLLLHALATCHSIQCVDGELIGDPMDLKMFEFTGWSLDQSSDNNLFVPTIVRPPKEPDVDMELVLKPSGPISADIPVTQSSAITKNELGIIRCFEFVSSLRRMSVIVKRVQGNVVTAFSKGAPEVIKDICRPSSLPEDYEEQLHAYAHRGYRVLACAGKIMPALSWHRAQKVHRNKVECEMHFLGFIVFENKLKRQTPPVLDVLRRARIGKIMCTGDNMLTAVSVARDSGLIDEDCIVYCPSIVEIPAGQRSGRSRSAAAHGDKSLIWECIDDTSMQLDPTTLIPLQPFVPMDENTAAAFSPSNGEESSADTSFIASDSGNDGSLGMANRSSRNTEPLRFSMQNYSLAITGELFDFILNNESLETIERLLVKGRIYARMSPDQKHELVERLQSIGYCVCMCGDGANDCGALKAADVGISLSEAEASVAAPFTSKSSNIECVPRLIREGRAALVTSFSCFKYIALYSMIQFTSTCLLYYYVGNLGDFQFLFIDIVLILPIAIAMGRTQAYGHIHRKRPTSNLVSKKVLISLIGHIIIQLVFQMFMFFHVKQQSFYQPPARDGHKNIQNFENTVLFLFSCYQYISVSIVFSTGPPYRKSMFSNLPYMTLIGSLLVFMSYLVLVPDSIAIKTLELMSLPDYYRYWILIVAAVNFIAFLVAEQYVFPTMATALSRLIYTKSALANDYHRDRWWHRFGIAGRAKKRLRFKVVRDEMGGNN